MLMHSVPRDIGNGPQRTRLAPPGKLSESGFRLSIVVLNAQAFAIGAETLFDFGTLEAKTDALIDPFNRPIDVAALGNARSF